MKRKVKASEEICYDLEGTITDVIKKLEEFKQSFGEDSIIEITTSGYDSPEAYIHFTRDETDYEYENRLEKEKAKLEKEEKQRLELLKKQHEKSEATKKRELDELARLKAKYENSN